MPVAKAVVDFLNSIGVNVHLEYTDGAYVNGAQCAAAMQYLGSRRARGAVPIASAGVNAQHRASLGLMMSAGVQCVLFANNNQSIATTISQVATLEQAHPGGIRAIEGANETNNFPIGTYNGQTGLAADLAYQRDLYAAVKANSTLSAKPVFYYTGTYVASTLATYADFANGHPYPSGNLAGGNQPGPRLDSDYTDHFSMALGSYPRVGTETGYTTVGGINEATQAKNLLNLYCSAFNQGLTEIHVYQLLEAYSPVDFDYGFGVFHRGATVNDNFTPKPAATAIHNMTTLLADTVTPATLGTLNYTLTGMPSLGKQMLLQKSTGVFELVLWSERQDWDNNTSLPITVANANVTVALGATFGSVKVFDPIIGLSAIQTLTNVNSVVVGITDHPVIVEVSGGTGGTMTVSVRDANNTAITATSNAFTVASP